MVCSTEWENLAGQELDLLLLDIEMPERDGISIKEEIGNGERPLIVFVTGYEEYMPRAFGKNVIGFVHKPIEEFDIFASLRCAVNLLTAGKEILLEEGLLVSTEQIQYFSADKRYTKAVLTNGEERRNLSKSLGDWEIILEDVYFLRISRFQLVNCKYIYDFNGNTITLASGEILKASKRNRKNCFDRFMEYTGKYGKHA